MSSSTIGKVLETTSVGHVSGTASVPTDAGLEIYQLACLIKILNIYCRYCSAFEFRLSLSYIQMFVVLWSKRQCGGGCRDIVPQANLPQV